MMRPFLHPLFQELPDGISELTFANLYLFRQSHNYRIAQIKNNTLVISGDDQGNDFFIVPFGLPEPEILEQLFQNHKGIKCVSERQAKILRNMGYKLTEDRDNFDYLYRREDLATLSGRKFHKKRNLTKAFINSYNFAGKPLLEEYFKDALHVLENWQANREDIGDYAAAREALEKSEELQLCGGIYYVEEQPVAYSLGEELACGESFVIHFEKAIGEYKGLWQFVNQAFASILPEKYSTINREQDLGDKGLRQAKLSYKPVDFVKKYRSVGK
jgi:hypothetical protein